jgi:hypothetical protein
MISVVGWIRFGWAYRIVSYRIEQSKECESVRGCDMEGWFVESRRGMSVRGRGLCVGQGKKGRANGRIV